MPVTHTALRSGLRAKALRCLSQREHSRSELQRKLRAWLADVRQEDASEEDGEHLLELVEQVLDELTQAAYLSDERTAESVVHSRQQRGFGVRRITQELKRKGIAPDSIATATADLHETQTERALAALLKRKSGALNASHKDEAGKEMQRRYQWLIRRGFASDVAQRALTQWMHMQQQNQAENG